MNGQFKINIKKRDLPGIDGEIFTIPVGYDPYKSTIYSTTKFIIFDCSDTNITYEDNNKGKTSNI